MSRTTALLLSALALALIVPASASATFPGTTGKIAFLGALASSSGSCSGPGCIPPSGVLIVNADGSGLRQLGSQLSGQSPAWSPSGKLAYVQNGALLVRSASLGKAKTVKLKGVRPSSVDNVAWAANGSQYYLRAITTSSSTGMGLVLAGGSLPTAKVLLRGMTDVQDISAAPNGKQIAFISTGTLYVANANGSNMTAVHSGGVDTVDWSPDSSMLVTSINGAIWTMSPTGANATQITQTPSAANWDAAATPSFTPDGQSILFILYGANPNPTPAEVAAAKATHGIASISTSGQNQQLIVPGTSVELNLAGGPVAQPLG